MPRRLWERWRRSGETKKVMWKHVRLALLLAGLCLAISAAGWWADRAELKADARQTQYETELNEWQRCQDRAESGGIIAAVDTAAVSHAEDTDIAVGSIAATFDEMIAVLEQSGSTSPRLTELRQIVDRNAAVAAAYGAGVDAYRDAAAAYVPQDAAECPPKPEHP